MPKTQKTSIITVRVSNDSRIKLFRKVKKLDTTMSNLLRDLIDAVNEDRITLQPPQPKGLYK